MSRGRPPGRPPASPAPARVVLLYAAFAAAWILASDLAFDALFTTPTAFATASVFKGWAFVLVSSLLLYAVLRRRPAPASLPASLPAPAATDRPQRVGALFVIVVALILAGTGLAVVGTVRHHRTAVLARIVAVAEVKATQFADWFDARVLGDAEFVRTNTHYGELYRHWQEDGDPDAGAALVALVERLMKFRQFASATLLDPTGRVLWSSSGAPATLVDEERAALTTTRSTNAVARVGPWRDASGQGRLVLVAPLAQAGSPAPTIVLRVDAERWVIPTLAAGRPPGADAETILFRRDGETLELFGDLRSADATPARSRWPLSESALLAGRLLRGEVPAGEVGTGLDHHGLAVAGVAHPVAGTEWFVLVTESEASLSAATTHDVTWVLMTAVFALFTALVAQRLTRQRDRLARAEAARAAQGDLLRTLHLLGAIADSSIDAIYAKDLEGRYLLFNRAASRMTGTPASEVLGRDDTTIMPAAQAAQVMATDRQVAAEGQVITFEETLTMTAGETVLLSTKGPLRDADGHIVGTFGTSRDITELKAAETSLRERLALQEQLSAVAQSAPGLIYSFARRPDGTVRLPLATSRVEDLFGFSAAQLAEDASPLLAGILPERLDDYLAKIEASERALTPWHDRYPYLHPDGGVRWIEGWSVPTREADGGTLWRGFAMDVTDNQLAEEALTRQAQELALRNAELERFNRAMVGRELDMIALKRDINALALRLGAPARYVIPTLDGPTPDGRPAPPPAAPPDAAAQTSPLRVDALRPPATATAQAPTPAPTRAIIDARPLVLVVKDAPETGAALATALGARYRVDCAVDGAEGLARARAAPPDLIVTDLMTPELGGEALVLSLRQDPVLAEVPIIVLTARADDEPRVRLLAAGVEEVLSKPFLVAEVLARADTLIADRRRARERLRESETRFGAIFEQAAVGIGIKAPDGRWLRVNQKLCEVTGYDRDELLTRTVADLTHPDDVAHDVDLHRQALTGARDSYATEKRYVRKGGDALWIHVTVALVRDAEGAPDFFVSVVEDIDARRQAEDEVQRLNADLEQRVLDRTAELQAANRELDTFAYAVSHDLRSPLRAMSGFSRALWEDYGPRLDGEAQVFLEQIDAASRRMAALIDGLLTLSRSTRGELERTLVDLSALATRALADLAAAEPSRVVRTEVEPGLEVRGDARTLEVVMRNLVDNAWKYSARTANAAIAVVGERRDGALWIVVRDNGAGFDEAFSARLFQPFQRLHREDEFPGLGIGLATVARILHRHGGQLEAHGAPGHGATFAFTLPDASPSDPHGAPPSLSQDP